MAVTRTRRKEAGRKSEQCFQRRFKRALKWAQPHRDHALESKATTSREAGRRWALNFFLFLGDDLVILAPDAGHSFLKLDHAPPERPHHARQTMTEKDENDQYDQQQFPLTDTKHGYALAEKGGKA
jgi:hypothetical protein